MKLQVAGVVANGVSTDSRSIAPGQLYVALQGPTHDGNDYVAAAFERGAAAAVVTRESQAVGPQLIVPDTLQWLQETARAYRLAWGRTVIAITGSAGKTTTKEATAAVCATRFNVSKTAGNFNNHIGVPLSILNIDDSAELAVIEIGMNHPGEIRHLAGIARPDIAVVTNVGTAHIEHLGSIEAIAEAKRELIEELNPAGVAVLNGDDARVREFASTFAGRAIFYGFFEAAHVRAEHVEYLAEGSKFSITDVGSFFCPLPGKGGLMAALAALGVARALNLPLAELAPAVAALEAPKMRLTRRQARGCVIWDDCYNSNPEAAMMMIDVLAATPARRRIAVLGQMLELGHLSEALHRDVGAYAARCGATVLVGIGGAARQLVEAGVEAGLEPGAAHFFDDPREAGRFLRTAAAEGDALLFKGSRGTRVELALEEFLK